uniref:Protein tyrosine phosphatase (ARSC2, arsC) n=1 Tax=uncultured marine group II/III euryarchaeote KM3_109_G01 TaxID=1457850 RepID=A0A075G7G9_9EURY|nr:protein tyrosine phosphatase (ARSC2, arsC) [uncultured marine group II/III euryarchaeote KM3_109_G01]
MRILFVCVGNSCRSQMAEGWARHLGLEAASAGTRPETEVAALAITVMGEVGIDISSQSPSHANEQQADQFDQVISMGCGVECPVHLPLVADWKLSDPYGGDIEEYRNCRDAIATRVRGLVKQ